MIGHSIPEYIFIRISIFLLRSVAPLSIAELAGSLYAGEWLFSRWLGYYAVAETAFYALVYLPRTWYMQKAAVHPTQLSREEREALFAKCFDQTKDADLAVGWFLGSSPEHIRRDNFVEWLLWALFSSRRDEFDEEWTEELEGYVQSLERLLGRRLEEGSNDEVRCMKVSMDAVISLHRPLVWYLIVGAVDFFTTVYLATHGFRHYAARRWYIYFPIRLHSIFATQSPDPNLPYWYRPHTSKTKRPVLFLHGIGIGLWPYLPFFKELTDLDPEVGVIAIEILPISMRISPPPLARETMLQALTTILDAHGFADFVVCGHSYGTVVAAHILRSPALSARVSGCVLVDPIPFLLHLPAVAHNFVYRKPHRANEWQLWYFASRDADVARALGRHFFWAENVLWKEDIAGLPVGVVLSECDQIVDAQEVRRYLTGEDEPEMQWKSNDGMLEVLWYPKLDHAQVFDSATDRRPLVQMVERLTVCRGSEGDETIG